MSSRLPIGGAMFAALVAILSLVIGAPGASAACPEPVFQKTFPYATHKQVVPMDLIQVTPGTEYLLKVDGREVKQGIADSDTVSRKFHMPNLGDKREKAKLVVIMANDGCENSPWKLKQTMGYRPLPKAEPPPAQQNQTPQQQAAPQATNPTPTPAPVVTPKPPKPQNIKPVIPKPPVAPREPPKDVKTWVVPLDPYSRDTSAPPQPPTSLAPGDRPTEKANSTAALLGLGGFFIVVGGISAMAWNRFRRYDDSQLAELLNPDGKLPNLLDDTAIDMQGVELTGAAGVAADKAEWKPTAAGPRVVDPKTGEAVPAPVKKASQADAPKITAPIIPPKLPPAAVPADAGNEKPTEPLPAAHQNGVHTNGHAANGASHSNGAGDGSGAHVAHDGNGSVGYRQEVEAELQRILNEAGLDAELGGILADAHDEAERKGVAIDSDLMLRALTEEANGSGKLTDAAKGELKQRFKRIAAEERGEISPGTDQ